MYSIAICDPDKQLSNTLALTIHQLLEEYRVTHAITFYTNSDVLYRTLKKFPEKFNLLFLETELSPYDGIELGLRLRKDRYDGNIVYMSSSDRHVFYAFNAEACQYYLKPVTRNQLLGLFRRLNARVQTQQAAGYLKLNHGTIHYKIRYSDINYIDTANRKIAIHTNKETIFYPSKLSEIEERLPKKLFIRIHQSYILQYYAVSRLAQSKAILQNGEELPISRQYKKQVQQFFSDFSE